MNAGSPIGNFVLDHRLGRGGMGEVWLAEHHAFGARVAIKLLLPDICEDEVHVQRFFNEARAVARIQHPGIVRIFDVGHADGRAYLVMELLEGETLAQRIRRMRMSLPQIADICRQIASVLEATQRAGVTHRDLKPDNIYLVRDPELPFGVRVKVLDFGIAKLTGTLAGGSPGTTGTLGTPAYMAPEQWGDPATVDWRADLYSLGCVAFELACGRPPFVATNIAHACAQHLHDPPPRVRSIVPALQVAFDELVASLLAKQPADRPARARDVTRAFAALADGAQLALADTQPSLAQTRRSRLPAVLALATATTVAAVYARGAAAGAPAPVLELAAADVPASPREQATRAIESPPLPPARHVAPARRAIVVQPPPVAPDPMPAPSVEQVDALTPLQFEQALAPYEPGVKLCGDADSPATIVMELVVLPNGHFGRATPLGWAAHTTIGQCASDALIKARFPVTRNGGRRWFQFDLR